MIEHLIEHKGKGFLVLILPLLIAFILFIVFGELNWNERYIAPISLLNSSIIIWFADNGPDLLKYGYANVVRSKNTLMWIPIKYLAMAMATAGIILLFVIVVDEYSLL